jgi:hypothetical protein
MRKALFLLLFVLGGVAFALVVGSKAASASTLPVIGQEQSGTNDNRTSQDASADATTQQTNVNAPISILSWGSNNGDVSQGNQAETKSYATNDNGTDQKVDQDQNASVEGSRGTSSDTRDGGAGVSQDQSASNDNGTEQRADSSAGTRQLNVNAPVSVLSWGSNNGDVDQNNDANTTAGAANSNGTAQTVLQDQWAEADGRHGKGAGIDQSQDATNDNETNQVAGADASTKQANVNVPVSVLSWGSNGGDVSQGNQADTESFATNDNSTSQVIGQDQTARVEGQSDGCHDKGYGDSCGCRDKEHNGSPSIEQSQSDSNDNRTDQDADASASTEQKDFNAPVSILSWGGRSCGCEHSDGASVDQANAAKTASYSENDNATRQYLAQKQDAVATDGRDADHGKGDDGDGKSCGCKAHDGSGSIDQDQSGSNANETNQRADSDATSEQKNVNAPFSLFAWGGEKERCGCRSEGDAHDGVTQHNDAKTVAGSTNANETRQLLGQHQEALIGRR